MGRKGANRTGDGLIAIGRTFGRIIGDPALHLHARIRAAVNEVGLGCPQCRTARTGAE
jgi:hypothetical protein